MVHFSRAFNHTTRPSSTCGVGPQKKVKTLLSLFKVCLVSVFDDVSYLLMKAHDVAERSGNFPGIRPCIKIKLLFPKVHNDP